MALPTICPVTLTACRSRASSSSSHTPDALMLELKVAWKRCRQLAAVRAPPTCAATANQSCEPLDGEERGGR